MYFNGQPVFNIFYIDKLSYEYVDSYKMVGSTYNKRQPYALGPGKLKLTAKYDQANLYDRKIFIDFFNDRKGKLKNFYLRTYCNTLEVISNYTHGDTQISVRNSSVANRYYSTVTPVYLMAPEGTSNKLPYIESAVLDHNNWSIEHITLNEGFDIDILAGNKLEYVYDVRFDTDTLTFEMTDVNYSTCTLQMITAKNYS